MFTYFLGETCLYHGQAIQRNPLIHRLVSTRWYRGSQKKTLLFSKIPIRSISSSRLNDPHFLFIHCQIENLHKFADLPILNSSEDFLERRSSNKNLVQAGPASLNHLIKIHPQQRKQIILPFPNYRCALEIDAFLNYVKHVFVFGVLNSDSLLVLLVEVSRKNICSTNPSKHFLVCKRCSLPWR